MRRLLFWSTLPLLLPQALWVRRRTPRFAAPTGAGAGYVDAPTASTTCSSEDALATRPPLRLLGLGDSIIAGVGAQTADECLTAQLAKELASRRDTAVEWRNIGRIGATTGRVLNDLAKRLPPESVDFVLVSVGVNDVTSLRRRSEWSREVRGLADLLSTHSPGVPVLFLGLPPMDTFPALPMPLRNSLGLRARLFEETLATTLAGHSTARRVQLTLAAEPGLFSADGFHPSAAAYAIIARILADALDERNALDER